MHKDRKGKRGGGTQNYYRATLALISIPFYLGVAPLVGWYLGRWVDSKVGSDWIFQALGVALGFVAAIRETARMIRRAQRDLGDR